MLQVKTLYHTEKQGFGYPLAFKKIPDTPTKPAEAEPSFRKVSLPLQNYVCFSPLTSGLRSFGHKSTVAYYSILASMKMGGA